MYAQGKTQLLGKHAVVRASEMLLRGLGVPTSYAPALPPSQLGALQPRPATPPCAMHCMACNPDLPHESCQYPCTLR